MMEPIARGCYTSLADCIFTPFAVLRQISQVIQAGLEFTV